MKIREFEFWKEMLESANIDLNPFRSNLSDNRLVPDYVEAEDVFKNLFNNNYDLLLAVRNSARFYLWEIGDRKLADEEEFEEIGSTEAAICLKFDFSWDAFDVFAGEPSYYRFTTMDSRFGGDLYVRGDDAVEISQINIIARCVSSRGQKKNYLATNCQDYIEMEKIFELIDISTQLKLFLVKFYDEKSNITYEPYSRKGVSGFLKSIFESELDLIRNPVIKNRHRKSSVIMELLELKLMIDIFQKCIDLKKIRLLED